MERQQGCVANHLTPGMSRAEGGMMKKEQGNKHRPDADVSEKMVCLHDWEYIRISGNRGLMTMIGGPKHFKCKKCGKNKIDR